MKRGSAEWRLLEFELDPLPARLSGSDAAGTGVKQARDLQLHRLFPEPEMPLVARIEILERGVELGAFGSEFGDGALQLLHRIRFPWVDRGEEGEALRMPLDNGGDEIVGEWRPVGRGPRIPGEQDAEDLLL